MICILYMNDSVTFPKKLHTASVSIAPAAVLVASTGIVKRSRANVHGCVQHDTNLLQYRCRVLQTPDLTLQYALLVSV